MKSFMSVVVLISFAIGLTGCSLSSPEIRAARVQAKVAALNADQQYYQALAQSYVPSGSPGTVEQQYPLPLPAVCLDGVLINPSTQPVTVTIRSTGRPRYSAIKTVPQCADGRNGQTEIMLPKGLYWVEVYLVGSTKPSTSGYCRVDGIPGLVTLPEGEVKSFAWFLR